MDVNKILNSIKIDPLKELSLLIKPNDILLVDHISRYHEAYYFYFLILKRLLPEISHAKRYTYQLRYKKPNKYSPSDKKLLFKLKAETGFLELDYSALIIQSRILLDKAASLSSAFIKSKERMPSFHSFADHKNFFKKQKNIPYEPYEKYAKYIREETDWFDHTLKPIRDHFIVHSSPKHLKFLGYNIKDELELIFFISKNKEKPLSMVEPLNINAVDIIKNVDHYLRFINDYGISLYRKN
jgi:hypothetical protein